MVCPDSPALLRDARGDEIASARMWWPYRRLWLRLLAEHEYGVTPQVEVSTRVDWVDQGETLGGRAVRRQAVVTLRRGGRAARLELLVVSPARAQCAPAVLGLNFRGNHATFDDPAVRVAPGADAGDRGRAGSVWPVGQLIDAGLAVATVWRDDAAPDDPQRFRDGALRVLEDADGLPTGDGPGAIAAWSWSLGRVLDVLQDTPGVDGSRVAVLGHSRLGKAALWAAAQDERFAAVVSNNSGCGGAALHRHGRGESIRDICERFPHWFGGRFTRYADREAELPMDQHALLACVAPRPVYIGSAAEDAWADPAGELLSLRLAAPVYRLLGARPPDPPDAPGPPDLARMPEPGGQNDGTLAYHLRPGGHGQRAWDWQRYVPWLKRVLGRAEAGVDGRIDR
jgi:hypothetical protein